MRYGLTPMSIILVIEATELFVWSVVSTMCPVSDALNATSAVSKSRISPTRITSGSCRIVARRIDAKVVPVFSCT